MRTLKCIQEVLWPEKKKVLETSLFCSAFVFCFRKRLSLTFSLASFDSTPAASAFPGTGLTGGWHHDLTKCNFEE
jgi:hypothetical protein